MWVESESYESIDPRAKHRLDGAAIALSVQKKTKHFKVAGTILDPAGNPISGVRVALPEYHVEDMTNQDGRFELQVVADSQHLVELVAQKQGYEIIRLNPTLGDARFNFSLKAMP